MPKEKCTPREVEKENESNTIGSVMHTQAHTHICDSELCILIIRKQVFRVDPRRERERAFCCGCNATSH